MHVWKAVCRKADRRGEIFVSRVQWGDWKCSAGSFLQLRMQTQVRAREPLSRLKRAANSICSALEGVASCLAGSSLISLATPFQYIHQSQFHSVCRGARCTKVLSSRWLALCAEINLWPVFSEIANTFQPQGRAYDGNSLRARRDHRSLLKGRSGIKLSKQPSSPAFLLTLANTSYETCNEQFLLCPYAL